MRLLAGIPCRVQWIDERESEFPAEARCRRTSSASASSRCRPKWRWRRPAPSTSCSRTATTSTWRITEAILQRGDFGCLGLIGSKTKRARFVHRFASAASTPALIERMTCPIGVPGIAGKEPEVIAVAVVAQLLQAGGGVLSAP